MKKIRSKKSRDTVPLIGQCHEIFLFYKRKHRPIFYIANEPLEEITSFGQFSTTESAEPTKRFREKVIVSSILINTTQMVTGFTSYNSIFNTGLDISTLTYGDYGRIQGGVSVLSHSPGGHR
jgi:hypothetical protein